MKYIYDTARNRQAAIQHLEKTQGKEFNSVSEEQCLRVYAFEDGAEWALSHQWISVDEELPPRNDDITYVAFSEHVLVRIDFEGNIIHRTAYYDYANKRWTMYDKHVTHWMHIPSLEGG